MNAHVNPPSPFKLAGAAIAAQGYKVIPIMPGKKVPGEQKRGRWVPMHNWPQHKDEPYGKYTLKVWESWDETGLGVILGNEVEPGWEVAAIDVDTDDDDDQALVDQAIPRSIVEKRGRRGQTGFYLVPAGTVGRRLKRGRETIFEVLTGNATRQTVIPPSIHPDTGMPYRWLTSRALADTPATELPKLTAADLARLMDNFVGLDGVEEVRAARVDPSEGAADGAFEAVKTTALRNLDAWVPALGLCRCIRTTQGYMAVPHWRPSGTGRALEDRKRSLGIHPTGIRDFGDTDGGFNAIGLVMRALDLDFGDALAWLEDKLGLTATEDWSDFPLTKSAPAADGETAPLDEELEIGAARAAVESAIRAHIYAGEGDRAICVTTGSGKTSIAIAEIAKEVHKRRAAGDAKSRVMYAVPTHKLGDAIVKQFEEHGIKAKVFRGRSANNPDGSGKMCGDLEAVEIALGLGHTVSTACCRGKKPETGTIVQCHMFDSCAYQKQTDEQPDVWVGTHQLLFTPHAEICDVAAVFVDESYWQKGTLPSSSGITIEELGKPPHLRGALLDEVANDLGVLRAKLARALNRQEELGGVARRHLVAEGLTADECHKGANLEWLLAEPADMWPGMPPKARKRAAGVASGIKFLRARYRVWTTARELLKGEDEDAVSGRLILARKREGAGDYRVVKTRGIKAIAAQWKVTTMVMDATLPGVEILRAHFPDIEVVAKIDAATPHVHLRQVVGAPVSSNKLLGSNADRNLHSIRRALILRHIAHGRQPTLVVAQKQVAEWLINAGLPDGVTVEWYNNVAGIDTYKDVRLLIAIGRTMPSVEDAEGLAGALVGLEAARVPEPTGAGKGRWYSKPLGAIRLRNGTTHRIAAEQHPDATAEAVRWQVCEAEIVQAIGRGRGVNRTVATPLAIEVWADVVLPMAMDEAVSWAKVPHGAEAEAALDGIALDSPSDMAACWPEAWPTVAAAKMALKREQSNKTLYVITIGKCYPAQFRYKLPGKGQKWRTGCHDPKVVGDPESWLTTKLGKLAAFEFVREAPAIIRAGAGEYVLREAPHPFPTRPMGMTGGWRAFMADARLPGERFLSARLMEPGLAPAMH